MRRLALALPLWAAAACGPPAELVAWDVTLTPVSDCRQTGQSTQCAQEDDLASSVRHGRWILDDRPGDQFLLTLEDGSTLAGLSFPNDGRNTLVVLAADQKETTGCSGEGGTCFFARLGSSGVDASTGCAREADHAVIVHEIEGELRGQVADISATAEDCATPTAAVIIADVTGKRAEEPALARERYGP